MAQADSADPWHSQFKHDYSCKLQQQSAAPASRNVASNSGTSNVRGRIWRGCGYHPFPKQREFHECKAKYRLFGGAAGPGKSKALLMEAIAQALEVPGSNTLLLRRTFPELENSLLLYFRRDVPRDFYASFNEAKHTVTWHNGSTTRFGYSQSEHDIYQYQSGEYLFIGIDELTHFTLRQWQFLTSRNRCPVRGSRPNMAGATNPGNIGHAWVKSLFIDKQPAAGMGAHEYDPSDYAFIRARFSDNPIYANDSNYLKTLEQLPDFYRRAFLDGDWSVFAGQYFTNFNPTRNVIRAERIGAADWWPRWISVDWGFEHPAAVYWHVLEAGGSRTATAGKLDAGRDHNADSSSQRERRAAPRTDSGAGDVFAARENASSVEATVGPPGRSPSTSLPSDSLRTFGRTSKQRPYEGSTDSDHSSSTANHHVSEEQRHRLREHQTRDSGDGPSAKKLAIPPAGDAGPLRVNSEYVNSVEGNSAQDKPQREAADSTSADPSRSHDDFLRCSPRSSPLTRAASPARNAAAPPLEAGGSRPATAGKLEAGEKVKAESSRPSDNAQVSGAALRLRSEHASSAPTTGRSVGSLVESPGPDAVVATITYREFVAQHLSPRVLAAQIIERSRLRDGRMEKIEAIYLSPDAFARRTDEASIAEQMGDIFASAGLPRPTAADNDRIGGWMLMYQMLDAGEWLIADACAELIRTLPELVRDESNIEDIAKRDGDDAADAARYGLKSRSSVRGARAPREQEFEARITSSDPTIRAIQIQKANLDLRGRGCAVLRPGARPKSRPRWLW